MTEESRLPSTVVKCTSVDPLPQSFSDLIFRVIQIRCRRQMHRLRVVDDIVREH